MEPMDGDVACLCSTPHEARASGSTSQTRFCGQSMDLMVCFVGGQGNNLTRDEQGLCDVASSQIEAQRGHLGRANRGQKTKKATVHAVPPANSLTRRLQSIDGVARSLRVGSARESGAHAVHFT
mmetsp:Transcript_46231/g.105959  ORF Transcript_46231/g.105959 Transcript_46231/m.105959 type:complete len:124 (+) Transcript_46231:999-1370(+)